MWAREIIEQIERFPGQYFDQETGLNYNYFRDYEPATGRYVESDPIGLLGGMNTYQYAKARPLKSVDPSGLIVPGSNCDTNSTMWTQLLNAEKNANQSAENCLGCKGNSLIGGKTAKDLSSALDTAVIDCAPTSMLGTPPIRSCGGNPEDRPGVIVVTPDAMDRHRCGCLQATLFHEGYHVAGVPGDQKSEDDLERLTRKCIPCGKPH